MALTIDEANAVSTKFFDKGMTQQVYESSPFYVKLKKMGNVSADGGTQIQFQIRYLELERADAVGPRQQLTYGQKETRTAGVLDWKYYIVDAMISWDERVKNAGKAKLVNLLADKAQEIKDDMAKRFATDLWTANPNGLGFTPISGIVDSADSYAGIAVSDAPTWAGIEDSSTTVLNLYGANSMSYLENQATFGTWAPDVWFTTKDLFSAFEGQLEPQKRYEDKDMADAGFRNLTFHGNPVLRDPFMPSGDLYGLCSKAFEIVYHEDFNMVPDAWSSAKEAGLPNAMIKTMSWAGNIKAIMRKCNCKFTALDYTLS